MLPTGRLTIGPARTAEVTKELNDNALVINSVEATKDADDLYMRKGQINVLAYILNLESTTNTNYEELNKAND